MARLGNTIYAIPGTNETALPCPNGANCTCGQKPNQAYNYIPGYEYLKYLGKGTFGVVQLYRHKKTGQSVAIKVVPYIQNGKNNYHEVLKEVKLVFQLPHRNIISYQCYFIIEERGELCIVMEHARNGSLRDKLNAAVNRNRMFDRKTILTIIGDIMRGAEYLESKNILHCDLKPENILNGNDGYTKICDFGTAKTIYDYKRCVIGTATYLAPELLQNQQWTQDEKTEVWSIGIIFYELCTLRHPFDPIRSQQELHQKAKAACYKPLDSLGYNRDMQEILSYMLQLRRENRKSLTRILQHSLFR